MGPAQERAVLGGGAAEHDMVATAGPGVAAVDHELVGAEPGEAGPLVEPAGHIDRFGPVRGRMDVDLDHAGGGGDLDDVDPGIVGGAIYFCPERRWQVGRGRVEWGHEAGKSAP